MPVQWVRRSGSARDKADNLGPPHGIKQITMFIRENVECLDSSFTTIKQAKSLTLARSRSDRTVIAVRDLYTACEHNCRCTTCEASLFVKREKR
ncbi:hypothetical protein J6590_000951 [Homalodisca vitripennis]|nr:hypothetical protein J6590_000951 [Homalodisca vitripennis]